MVVSNLKRPKKPDHTRCPIVWCAYQSQQNLLLKCYFDINLWTFYFSQRSTAGIKKIYIYNLYWVIFLSVFELIGLFTIRPYLDKTKILSTNPFYKEWVYKSKTLHYFEVLIRIFQVLNVFHSCKSSVC